MRRSRGYVGSFAAEFDYSDSPRPTRRRADPKLVRARHAVPIPATGIEKGKGARLQGDGYSFCFMRLQMNLRESFELSIRPRDRACGRRYVHLDDLRTSSLTGIRHVDTDR